VSINTTKTLPSGDLELTPIRLSTVTRDGRKAIVFAETERRYFGVYYTGDVYGWASATWFRPGGTYKLSGDNAAMDLNLTQKGMTLDTSGR